MEEMIRTFAIGPADVEKIAAEPNDPHHHDFEELIIGREGTLEHFIDFRSETIAAPFVSFVTKGKVHRVRPGLQEGRCDMRVVRFHGELIPETIFQLYSLFHGQAQMPVEAGRSLDRLCAIAGIMADELEQPTPDLAVVRQLLGTLFTLLRAMHRERHPDAEADALATGRNETFRHFLQILEENFRLPHDVEFYASQLFMSARNLNLITQSILQQSVSRIVETRKLIEAKNLLITTDRPIAEIGFELGYEENSYFTRVFRKNTGQTPTEFREEMRRLVG